MAVEQMQSYNASLNTDLKATDPEIYRLVELEKVRQYSCLELIASENFTSQAVLEACGSVFTNKYSEGLPNCRYYGGNEVVDQLELLCQKRALDAFDLDPSVWGCNVQPYSGSTANFAAYTALIKPNDKLMGLDLPSGGHLTHGYQTKTKKISATSIYFQSKPYQINSETGLIDYDLLEKDFNDFQPNLLVCGASAYPRDFDYERLRAIAKSNNAYILCDMAHISGLVAAKRLKNPFDYCDVVTTTTHKTLRGPRAGLIFFRKDGNYKDLETRINQAVFPACQGGPHNHIIAGIAVALKLANTQEFKEYCKQVQSNTKTLAQALMNKGYKMVSDGTENHLVLWDLRPLGITGSKFEKICDLVNITLNKNSVHGDKSALSPGGVRIGTSAMTSRSLVDKDFKQIAAFLERAVNLTKEIQSKCQSKLLKDFTQLAEKEFSEEIKTFKLEVTRFARLFPIPGFDSNSIDPQLLMNQE